MHLQFIGSGDAFGSGGRFNTCLHLVGERANLLIDCGASSLVAMKRLGIDRNAIDAILLTHFHADHFGGIPFFMLDAQFISRRERPLTIIGPPGLRDRLAQVMEAAFPGSSETQQRFPLSLHEIPPPAAADIKTNGGTLRVTPFHVVHDDRAGPCLALRIEIEGRVVTYSGDTEWTDALLDAARDADLFVCECFAREKPVKSHMTLSVLQEHVPAIGAKRLVLTHMSEDMLASLPSVPYETAEDGKTVKF
jgi:ribonuclease BN (tRNA processing enzyme)